MAISPTTTTSTGSGFITVTPSQPSAAVSNSPNFNFAVIIQVPLPIIGVDVKSLVADYVLAALSVLKIPEAIQSLLTNGTKIIQNIVDDATKLIQAIPQATFSIVFRVGDVVVLNVLLVAQQTPVQVQTPTYQLALPNFAVEFPISIPFPIPPPVVIHVPIPVPSVSISTPVIVSGGEVSVESDVVPQPVKSPIVLPNI